MDETITRSLDSLHYYRLSTTPPMLAKEKSLHSQLERGSEIDSSVRDTQVGRKRCCSTNKAIAYSHNKPYVCGPKKRRRLEANHRPEIPQFLPRATTLQDGGSLYVTKHIISLGWFMVKIDLKDAYLTIPIAQNFQSPLAFQATPQDIMQFQCLPFGLCTAPFVFSKVIKPIVQFLHQLGIHLIFYLHDLMLVASSESQLLQDLSTVLWLFVVLDFIINIPKSVIVLTQYLEFLGFVINTQNMTIALPSQKTRSIQKEATHLLPLDTVQVRTLAHFICTLVATRPAVPTRLLCYRALKDLKIKTFHQSSSYQVMGQVTREVQVDLRWWKTQLPTCCSSPIAKQEAMIVIKSDASNSGWGQSVRK